MREIKQGGPPLGPYARLTGQFTISSLWVLFTCVNVRAAMAQAGTLASTGLERNACLSKRYARDHQSWGRGASPSALTNQIKYLAEFS